MARVTKQKRTPESLDGNTLADVHRKRTKTVPAGDDSGGQAARRSGRSNMGKGGQIAQLESIERVQTQSRPSKLAVATANEPLNPMAPTPGDARRSTSKASSGDTFIPDPQAHPSAHQQFLPTYQSSMEGSRYGFDASLGKIATNLPQRQLGTPSSSISGDGPNAAPGAALSRPGSAPWAGYTVQETRAGSRDPVTRPGSIAPTSRSGSTVPPSRAGSTAPMKRVASSPVTSHGGPPSSRSNSVASNSHGGMTRPISRSGSVAPRSEFDTSLRMPQTPLRASQVAQLTRVPFTRTYSGHNLEDMTDRASRPPSYYSHDDAPEVDDLSPVRNAVQQDEPPIDELSPDEDDRAAEAFLRANSNRRDLLTREGSTGVHPDIVDDPAPLVEERSGAVQGSGNGEFDPHLLAEERERLNESAAVDVVSQYHQRNRIPRPPNPSTLHDVRLQQQRRPNIENPSCSHSGRRPTAAATPDPPQSEAASVAGASADGAEGLPSANVPPGPLTGLATKLRSYPHKFREVIERAKQISQCESAVSNPFPSRSEFVERKSGEHLTEALNECKNIPEGYWPQYQGDLGVLLWEALMTWRSTLKAKAREIVPRFYNLGGERSSDENKAEAERLIRGSAFTRDGVDDEGSTNNMAAPALAALVTSFFYTGPSALGVLFPEVFDREVPKVTVCLAATALRAAIDEYIISGTRQDRTFEYASYSKVYANFYMMQLTIDEDPKHAAKTEALRNEWAASARASVNEIGAVIAFDSDFRPVLD